MSKKNAKSAKKGLDNYFAKRSIGRPILAARKESRGRADNYRWIFNQVWAKLWPTLQLAECSQDVTKEFERFAAPYHREFVPAFSELILWTLHDPDFPKRNKAQINFMADSIAALGRVAPRRSRDICQEQRQLEKQAHHIIRYEFFVECSCGYKGRSLDHACRKCGAEIIFPRPL